jgi:hypothetical protein
MSDWWFGTFFIFHNPSKWLIFFWKKNICMFFFNGAVPISYSLSATVLILDNFRRSPQNSIPRWVRPSRHRIVDSCLVFDGVGLFFYRWGLFPADKHVLGIGGSITN